MVAVNISVSVSSIKFPLGRAGSQLGVVMLGGDGRATDCYSDTPSGGGTYGAAVLKSMLTQ
ncbi:hypothetical protein MmonteBS_07010 [Mycobacterium montefiorense]|uniref:Uncharacterized protein n=1 Tax=Mycobacterium montefiorense TaxID=154654 RepID=A0AA37UXS1_9MYCO|nr:hypothetical protein MmonteBS_07010 [Mycobacterium montefiorense]GKU32902.1 hypothetical protein NJB14191_02490 [Mycobacterium montefiorense]GKU38628.1 hypothetical protein NJB14192_06260 [Mycobacterium montefiorense]GKU46605.1 hypothetical protein NJB14194_32230 [Mycobacterium montefiorense]GKU51622.1 hypothetical protein NJB14195_28680 [Mycobacterium montefiorense]